MAPQVPPSGDSGQIKVQLSLLSAQDTAAAQQLANSVGEIAKMFEALKASDFRDTAEKMAKLHSQMVSDTERLQQQARQAQGGPSTVEKVKNFLRMGGGTGVTDQELADAGVRGRAETDKEQARKAAEQMAANEKERLRRESLSSEQHAADVLRRRYGLPPIDPDAPPTNAWYDRIDSLTGGQSGLRIPQFGQLTIQDYFNLLRNNRVQSALQSYSQGDTASAAHFGSQARMLQQGSTMAGSLYAVRAGFQRMMGFLAARGYSPGSMDAAGAQLGYRRTEGAGPGGWLNDVAGFFGVQSPFTHAGGEGWKQAWDIQTLRMQSGINGEQAAKIVQASASSGFSGSARQAIARDFMAPLFRQWQVDPQTLVPFTQVLRTGTASVADLSRELSSLGEQARAARVDVNTMAQALSQSGEASQSAGGFFMSGVQFGRTFSTSYGLLPNTGNSLLQNPFVQANISAMTGLPGFASAAAPTGAKMQAIQRSMQMYYNAFSGALGTQGTKTPIRLRGQIVGYDQGSNPALAALASQFGLSSDEAQKLLQGQDRASAIATAQTVLDSYGHDAMNATNQGDVAKAQAWARAHGYQIRNGEVWSKHTIMHASGKGMYGTNQWGPDAAATEHLRQMAYDKVTAMSHLPGHIGRQQVIQAAHDAGVFGPDLGKALSGNDVNKQIKDVRRLITQKAAEDQAKYEIAFTGPAAKFFKALVNKNGGWDQLGGEPSNVLATSSAGPKPLSDLSNSGLSPFGSP